MGFMKSLLFAACAIFFLLSRPAFAQDSDEKAQVPSAPAAKNGLFLPFSLAPRVDTQAALVTTVAGYDGARQAAILQAAAEVHLGGPLSLRAGAVYSDG